MVSKHRSGRGASRGQHHSSNPRDLPSYEVPPAGPVKITRADGTVEYQAPQPAKATPARPRRRPARRSAEPVPIDKIRDTPFVPANLRHAELDEQGRPRISGWTRNNRDALPRGEAGQRG